MAVGGAAAPKTGLGAAPELSFQAPPSPGALESRSPFIVGARIG